MRAEAQKPQAVPPPSRMKLGSVVRGKQEQPVRVLVYGVDGIGKTTFGANAPSPIFIGAEQGTSQIDVPRFPAPESWQEIQDAVRELGSQSHDYQTLVIDSLDWAEPLCWRHLCEKEGVNSIEKVGGGFGKGYVAAVDEWRLLLASLERLSTSKRMHVVMIAHSIVKTFKNPAGDDYDRYQIKLHEKSAGLIREWCDAVLFANYEVGIKRDERTKRVRGVDTGARLLYTTYSAAWEAKNRYSLPAEIPLSWDDFFKASQSGEVSKPDDLRAEIERKANEIGGEVGAQALAYLKAKAKDTAALAVLNNKLNAKLAEKENGNG